MMDIRYIKNTKQKRNRCDTIKLQRKHNLNTRLQSLPIQPFSSQIKSNVALPLRPKTKLIFYLKLLVSYQYPLIYRKYSQSPIYTTSPLHFVPRKAGNFIFNIILIIMDFHSIYKSQISPLFNHQSVNEDITNYFYLLLFYLIHTKSAYKMIQSNTTSIPYILPPICMVHTLTQYLIIFVALYLPILLLLYTNNTLFSFTGLIQCFTLFWYSIFYF